MPLCRCHLQERAPQCSHTLASMKRCLRALNRQADTLTERVAEAQKVHEAAEMDRNNNLPMLGLLSSRKRFMHFLDFCHALSQSIFLLMQGSQALLHGCKRVRALRCPFLVTSGPQHTWQPCLGCPLQAAFPIVSSNSVPSSASACMRRSFHQSGVCRQQAESRALAITCHQPCKAGVGSIEQCVYSLNAEA